MAIVFLGIFFAVASAYVSLTTSSVRSVRYDIESAQALALAEAGVDEAIYQMNENANYAGETNTILASGAFTVTVSNVNTNTKRLVATGAVPDMEHPLATKTVTTLVNINTSIVSFRYGAQVGAGGVSMENGSEITGNLFSGGNVSGDGTITGDATVASGTPATSLDGITVQGTVRAHTLSDCTIGGDAYYQTISNCSVGGTAHPGSADLALEALPISDAQIDEWETIAAAGTVINGNYTLNGSQILGPALINGDLIVQDTLILRGVVWVKGNVTLTNNAELTVAPSTGNEGAILIADVPGNETTKGIVTLANNVQVSGNGAIGSYPMILSTNSGSTAITLNNNVQGVILYASHGTIAISNNAGANQITAYRLSLDNNATVTYVSGLQNQNFSHGPGGSWMVVPHSYAITN